MSDSDATPGGELSERFSATRPGRTFTLYDIIVIGGSYAGMAAALQVARARRQVLVIDAGIRRNRFASSSHGFLGQDGADPDQIALQARKQLRVYSNLEWLEGRAARAAKHGAGFTVVVGDGKEQHGRRLILALGVTDILPGVSGLEERWGKTVFHCPYCHGYELQGGPVAVLAVGPVSMHQAILIPDWGPATFLLNGAFEPDEEQRAQLAARGVAIETTPVARLSGEARCGTRRRAEIDLRRHFHSAPDGAFDRSGSTTRLRFRGRPRRPVSAYHDHEGDDGSRSLRLR